jgi:wyosine [tRNA(Phe)-imidazoG37] synthetase (radical SAM superfamily)
MDLQAGLVYGPLETRRLGRSLGVNLAPAGRKACNFNCSYCQYGWTNFPARGEWPRPADVIDAVDRALLDCGPIDHITVAGNGEPTLHPAFAPIAEGLARVRARRAPGAKLALLSNGSTLDRLDVVHSLRHFDERHMKLDAGDATTFRLLNASSIPLARLIANLRKVGNVTLQSMFVRDAEHIIDNTTPRAIEAWLGAVEQIGPASVQLYSLHRAPARTSLLPVPAAVLQDVADSVSRLGIPALVFA